jgi:U3 small nucleolar RNA-associated protein 23
MRHLYATRDSSLIELAKSYERRRCNHHELEKPLSTLECLSVVVDPKSNNVNKHNYIVASQTPEVRAHFRHIPGVPLVYVNRSVMILEPISGASDDLAIRDEKSKLRAGLKSTASVLGKRLRTDEDEQASKDLEQKKKRKSGMKGPNPLSVLKPKRRNIERKQPDGSRGIKESQGSTDENNALATEKKKRKRKPSKRADENGQAQGESIEA